MEPEAKNKSNSKKHKETDPEITVEVKNWETHLTPEKKKTEETKCRCIPVNEASCIKIANMDETMQYEVFVIENFLSPDECDRLLLAAEEFGFGRTDYPKSYRGNLRLQVLDMGRFSEILFDRIKPFLPQEIELKGQQYKLMGLNEMWRLAKYYPGDRFQGHCDANFNDEKRLSMFTVNLYANDAKEFDEKEGFEGGATRFYNKDKPREVDFHVVPKKGTAILFRQPPGKSYYHDGEELKTNTKYLFRSDVMYLRGKPKK